MFINFNWQLWLRVVLNVCVIFSTSLIFHVTYTHSGWVNRGFINVNESSSLWQAFSMFLFNKAFLFKSFHKKKVKLKKVQIIIIIIVLEVSSSSNNNNKEYLLFDLCVCVYIGKCYSSKSILHTHIPIIKKNYSLNVGKLK